MKKTKKRRERGQERERFSKEREREGSRGLAALLVVLSGGRTARRTTPAAQVLAANGDERSKATDLGEEELGLGAWLERRQDTGWLAAGPAGARSGWSPTRCSSGGRGAEGTPAKNGQTAELRFHGGDVDLQLGAEGVVLERGNGGALCRMRTTAGPGTRQGADPARQLHSRRHPVDLARWWPCSFRKPPRRCCVEDRERP